MCVTFKVCEMTFDPGGTPQSQMGNWRMFTVRPLYPAVVVDETQPLHSHVSHMTPPEQDFSWKGRRRRRKKHKQIRMWEVRENRGTVWCDDELQWTANRYETVVGRSSGAAHLM